MFDPEMIRKDGNEDPKPDEINAETQSVEESVEEPTAEQAEEPVEEPVTGDLTPTETPEEPRPQGPEPGTYAWFQVEKYKKAVSNREAMADALSGRSLKLYAILASVKQGWTLLISIINLFLLPLILVAMASGSVESGGMEFSSGMDLFAIADLILVWILVAHLGKNGGKNLMGDIRGLRIVRTIQLVAQAIGTVAVVLLSGFVAVVTLFVPLSTDELIWEIGPQYGELIAGLIGILPIIMVVASVAMVLEWIYQFCLHRYLGDNMKFLEGESVEIRTGYLRFWQIMRIIGQAAGVVIAIVAAGLLLALPELLGIGSQTSNGVSTVLIVVVPVLLSIFGSALEIALCVFRLRLFAKGEKVIRSN